MTATTYEVQLDGDLTVTVENAEYYKREDGWVTFKDAEHKVITDFPEGRIRLIARCSVGVQAKAEPAIVIDPIDEADRLSREAFYRNT